jgi:hypothetical protein
MPGSQCQQATCNSETCVTITAPQGTPCNQGGGQLCNNVGNCVQCITSSNCPQPGNLQCAQATCSAQTCGISYAPAGTACNQGGTNCDGAGNCV